MWDSEKANLQSIIAIIDEFFVRALSYSVVITYLCLLQTVCSFGIRIGCWLLNWMLTSKLPSASTNSLLVQICDACANFHFWCLIFETIGFRNSRCQVLSLLRVFSRLKLLVEEFVQIYWKIEHSISCGRDENAEIPSRDGSFGLQRCFIRWFRIRTSEHRLTPVDTKKWPRNFVLTAVGKTHVFATKIIHFVWQYIYLLP